MIRVTDTEKVEIAERKEVGNSLFCIGSYELGGKSLNICTSIYENHGLTANAVGMMLTGVEVYGNIYLLESGEDIREVKDEEVFLSYDLIKDFITTNENMVKRYHKLYDRGKYFGDTICTNVVIEKRTE